MDDTAQKVHCKICLANVDTFYDDYMKCQTYHCSTCEFIFKDDKAIVSNDKELKVYKQHNNTEENAGYVSMFEDFITKTITPHKEQITKVLDFGSGPTPVLASLLTRHGFDVEHYDKFFSTEKVYEGKQYDLITSTEVIEHIADIQEAMHFFTQHLVEGGYLALMTQFHTNEKESYLKWWYRRDPTHISFFRPHTFMRLAKQHNFTLCYNDNKKLVLLQKNRT